MLVFSPLVLCCPTRLAAQEAEPAETAGAEAGIIECD